MDRRDFLSYSALGVAGILLPKKVQGFQGPRGDAYSIVILGDTHYDTEPASVYHSNYNEPVEWLNRVQREEFARNGEMWRERCPRILKRAACLISDDTRMVFQTGDLIQGDCGSGEVHRKMLDDVITDFKEQLGGLPFVTVVGNHDIRGVDARKVYSEYMPEKMSSELGKKITKTTFSFSIGDDAYLALDFNRPDDEEVEKLLEQTRGARNTFILTHGPLFPYDAESCNWFYHGKDKTPDARRHFREEFARRKAICLCGHTHRTEFADWYGDGGRITQMTMSSVWAKESQGKFVIDAEGAEQYGTLRMKAKSMPDGSPIEDRSDLFNEYRPGLRSYIHANSAGCYKMTVDGRHVHIDFYAGDSSLRSHRFILRQGL